MGEQRVLHMERRRHSSRGYRLRPEGYSIVPSPLVDHENEDEETKKNLKGRLTVGSMQVPFLPEQKIEMPLEAAQNRLLMPEATTLTVPGGTVRMGPSRVTGLMGPHRSFIRRFILKIFNWPRWLPKYGRRPLTGLADGHLDPIHIEGERLQSTGEIKGDIFGGTVTLSNVGARGLFTTLPLSIWMPNGII
jgi:hypothetical protein